MNSNIKRQVFIYFFGKILEETEMTGTRDWKKFIDDKVDQLIAHLNDNLVCYHKVIWMDRDELYMILDGFYVPYGKRFEDGEWKLDSG